MEVKTEDGQRLSAEFDMPNRRLFARHGSSMKSKKSKPPKNPGKATNLIVHTKNNNVTSTGTKYPREKQF